MHNILQKSIAGRRLTPEEGLQLIESHDLAALGRAADAVCRRLHPEPYRTYNIDRNINYTNICAGGCRFCAFFCKPDDPQGYVLDAGRTVSQNSRRRSNSAAIRFSCKADCIRI